jgi:nicotinamide-nucleotide amidase
MRRIANRLVKLLQEKGLTLSLAESMTCGLASHHLGMVKGTMDVFKGSLVCYHPAVKVKALRIPARLIRKHSAESQEVTDAMAKGLHRLFKTDVYGAVTGLAADGGSERKGKPVGTVFFTVVSGNRISRLRKVFRGTPLEIEQRSCRELYNLIYKTIRT